MPTETTFPLQNTFVQLKCTSIYILLTFFFVPIYCLDFEPVEIKLNLVVIVNQQMSAFSSLFKHMDIGYHQIEHAMAFWIIPHLLKVCYFYLYLFECSKPMCFHSH